MSQSIFDPAVFASVSTFMGAPQSYDLTSAKAAILGVPFDCGTHAVRIGARLGLVDCGNVRLVPSRIEDAFAAIEAAVSRIVSAGAIPLTMGGDGSVTLPQLRALHRKHPGLVVLHIDAHTDTYPGEGKDRYNTATTFTRAAEEGVVDAAHSFHVGARGPVYLPGVFEHTRQHGYRLVPGAELQSRGIEDVLAEIHRSLAGRKVYLCFDMDFFDPSCAPGVCTPAWGGASARERIASFTSMAAIKGGRGRGSSSQPWLARPSARQAR